MGPLATYIIGDLPNLTLKDLETLIWARKQIVLVSDNYDCSAIQHQKYFHYMLQANAERLTQKRRVP